MLRVTSQSGPSRFRLRLEGRLAGPWVREVELCWRIARADNPARKLTVDLRDVDFVDCAGEELLAAMHQGGATLLATGAMTKSVVARILVRKKKRVQ